MYSVDFGFCFSSWLCCPLRFQNSPQTRWWEGFLVFGNFSTFTYPSPGWLSISNSFVSHLLYFVLPPFKDNVLPFWGPVVLCQRSEVVLWNLLNVQMTFRWICGVESGLPDLFLCHLGTAPLKVLNESISPGSHCNIFCPDCWVSFSNLYKGKDNSPYLGIQIWQ